VALIDQYLALILNKNAEKLGSFDFYGRDKVTFSSFE
jgi:hypothetical protein